MTDYYINQEGSHIEIYLHDRLLTREETTAHLEKLLMVGDEEDCKFWANMIMLTEKERLS